MMAENKRFYRDFSEKYGTSIRDKSNDDKPVFIFSVHGSEDLCDIFNEFADENEQLKQRIKVLEDTVDGLAGTIAHSDLGEVMWND